MLEIKRHEESSLKLSRNHDNTKSNVSIHTDFRTSNRDILSRLIEMIMSTYRDNHALF